jgi:hypothetical protein
MDWISTKERMPLAYKTGIFDGKKSDEVIAEDVNGKRYLATYYEGTLDGTEFKNWYYMEDNFDIKEPIVRFLELPE